ncbi:unnamed protein product [Heligmosomoides polygyrus]|uniref:Protein C19orf12 homolog n=1 Tax=Heligmosomoides polygyrus TaxID=6339 RepID=A0A183F371_HELPZ|nr:unnamed protein product [Heligmosomoides polygyrus]
MSIVYFNEILNVVGNSAKLKNTISGVAKQTGCAAAGTAAGGLIMRPIGALFDGVMGAIYSYQNSGDFDNIVTCLSSMADDERRQVVARVQHLVKSVSIEELVRYLSTEAHREMLIGVLSDFVSQKMSS